MMMIQREYAADLYATVKAAITRKIENDATQSDSLQFNQFAPYTADASSEFSQCICNVKKYNVTAFCFQLLATKLLTFEIVDRTNVMCISARSKHDKYEFVYYDPFAWEGFGFVEQLVALCLFLLWKL